MKTHTRVQRWRWCERPHTHTHTLDEERGISLSLFLDTSTAGTRRLMALRESEQQFSDLLTTGRQVGTLPRIAHKAKASERERVRVVKMGHSGVGLLPLTAAATLFSRKC